VGIIPGGQSGSGWGDGETHDISMAIYRKYLIAWAIIWCEDGLGYYLWDFRMRVCAGNVSGLQKIV